MTAVLVPLLAALWVFSPSSFATTSNGSGEINALPIPVKYTTGSKAACLADSFSIQFDSDVPADLSAASDRVLERIKKSQHTYLTTTSGTEFFPSLKCESEVTELRLSLSSDHSLSIFDLAIKPVEERKGLEDYTLTIPTSGAATATASTALGLFRAITTFENLVFKIDFSLPSSPGVAEGGDTAYLPFTPYHIDDAPAFHWRSILLDTSRHFFAKQSLFKLLDTMSAVKLNVFHWHITDSQSWPLALNELPELAAKGAYTPRKTYSEQDVAEIIQFAGERGIDVVMEIDTPGHTTVIGNSHPDMIACNTHKPWTGWANEPPAGQLRFADPAVTAFTSRIFSAAIKLTKSAYFGTGGDELNEQCMDADQPTQRVLKANGWTLNDALKNFTAETHGTLLSAKRTPMVWQEMVLAHGDLELDKNTIVDVWISSADVGAVLDKGFRLVHASSDYFYLDCGQGGWITENVGSNSWCDPFKAWTRMYSFNPYTNVTAVQRPLVLGGQASLWCEQTDETNFETVMWPRAAAVAELWWSGGNADGTFPRSAVDALPRMHDMRYRLVEKGVRAEPLQPEWCAVHPGRCVLGG